QQRQPRHKPSVPKPQDERSDSWGLFLAVSSREAGRIARNGPQCNGDLLGRRGLLSLNDETNPAKRLKNHDLATKNSFHGGQKRRFVSWPLRNPATLLTLPRPRITLLAVGQPFSSEMRFSMKPALLGMLGTFLGLDTDAWWFIPLLVLAAVALIFVFRHACLV